MHPSGPVNMDTAEKDRAKEKHRISKSKCVKRPWIEGAFFYPCEGDVLETKALMFRQEDLTAARLYRKKSWNQICFLLKSHGGGTRLHPENLLLLCTDVEDISVSLQRRAMSHRNLNVLYYTRLLFLLMNLTMWRGHIARLIPGCKTTLLNTSSYLNNGAGRLSASPKITYINIPKTIWTLQGNMDTHMGAQFG